MKRIKQQKAKTAGFTLIETFVAISVLLVALSGALAIGSRGLAASRYAKDQVVAYYLSQDAMEYVRYVRDSNGLSGRSWLSGLGACMGGGSCTVDSPNNVIAACSSTCPPLHFDPATGFYGYAAGQNSIYTRSVTITQIDPFEVVVRVSVSWMAGNIPRSFTVRDNLLNWR